MLRALRGANDFERRARGAERTLGRDPQVVRHLAKEFESEALLGRKFSDGMAQCNQRTDDNDARSKGLQIGVRSSYCRSRVNEIVDDRDAFALTAGCKGSGTPLRGNEW